MKYGGKALQQQTSFPLCHLLVQENVCLWLILSNFCETKMKILLVGSVCPRLCGPCLIYMKYIDIYIDNPEGSVCPRLCGPCPPRRRRRCRRPPRLRTPIRSPGRPWVRQKENYKNKNMMNADQIGHECPLSKIVKFLVSTGTNTKDSK